MVFLKQILARKRGRLFEHLAQQFLTLQGCQVITRNFSSFSGEIDLIMLDKNTLIFVEVRYRHSDAYGSPLDSIDYAKQQRLENTAEFFLKRQAQYRHYPYRFDAVLISHDYLQWLKNIFG